MFSCRFEVSFPQNLELLFWSSEQMKIFTFLFQNFRWSSSSYYPSFLSWGPSWAGEKQRTLEVGWTGWFHCVLRYFPSPVATWFSSCTSELGPDTERDHSGAGLCRACFQKYITNDIITIPELSNWHVSWRVLFYPENRLLISICFGLCILLSFSPTPLVLWLPSPTLGTETVWLQIVSVPEFLVMARTTWYVYCCRSDGFFLLCVLWWIQLKFYHNLCLP